jgi:hypothetical protein
MNKVKVNPEREIKKMKAVNDFSFNLKNYNNIRSLNHYLFLQFVMLPWIEIIVELIIFLNITYLMCCFFHL